jgi:hypothetical protein
MIAFQRRLVSLGAILFVGLGLWLMFDPRAVEWLYPITLDGPMGVSEMRAIFGGLMSGVGAGILWLVMRDAIAGGVVTIFVYGGLLLARVVGLANEGVPHGPVLTETMFEIVFFVLVATTTALVRHRTP